MKHKYSDLDYDYIEENEIDPEAWRTCDHYVEEPNDDDDQTCNLCGAYVELHITWRDNCPEELAEGGCPVCKQPVRKGDVEYWGTCLECKLIKSKENK